MSDIGWAVEAMRQGKRVHRRGWNGKGMYLWLKPPADIQESWCRDPFLLDICRANGGHVEASGAICMYTAQHTVVTGWLASQTDLLASDWHEYKCDHDVADTEE